MTTAVGRQCQHLTILVIRAADAAEAHSARIADRAPGDATRGFADATIAPCPRCGSAYSWLALCRARCMVAARQGSAELGRFRGVRGAAAVAAGDGRAQLAPVPAAAISAAAFERAVRGIHNFPERSAERFYCLCAGDHVVG